MEGRLQTSMIWAKTNAGWKRESKEKKEKGFYLF
jgi:hypothetical protein